MKELIKLSTGETIKLVKPKVRAMMNAQKEENEMERTVALIAVCTNQTVTQVEEMELADFAIVRDELDGFLLKSGFFVQTKPSD